MLAASRCLLLTLLLACSPVSAQELTRTITETSPTELLPAYPGERMTLEHLCDRATRTSRARQWTRDHSVLSCRAERTIDPGISLVLIDYPDGEEALIAIPEQAALRVLGVVDECLGGPDGHSWCSISLGRLARRDTSRGPVVLVETASTFYDYDVGVLVGVRVERRHLTVCDAQRCAISVPLETTLWSIALTEGRGRPGWPYDEHETRAASSRAIAVLRPDGSVRLTLRTGDWRSLFDGSRDWRAQPDAALRDVIVRE